VSDEKDQKENELFPERGVWILSAYTCRAVRRFGSITEVHCSSTTILLPEEY
jgi:hypothetical protein